jgi:hypothetical protein
MRVTVQTLEVATVLQPGHPFRVNNRPKNARTVADAGGK